MQELSIRIGGQKYKLKESDQEFSVLTTNTKAIDKLRHKKGVKNVVQAVPGIQVVKSTGPKARDLLMSEIRKSGVSHHVYEVPHREIPKRFVITDKVNIKFKDNLSKEEREEFLRKYHLQFRKELAPNLYSCQVTNETGMNPVKLCAKLDGSDKLEYIEPDFVMKNKLFEPTIQDQLFKDAWHLNDSVNIPFVSKGSDIKVKGAWSITKGKPSIIIAVMDDGFDLTNPDLKFKVKFPADFTRTDSVSGDPTHIEPDDDLPLAENTGGRTDYHGTPCAGLALASEGHGQVIGVAPGCSFMPVRWNVEESTINLILDIFRYISKRADIVSCSWGGLASPDSILPFTVRDTINELARNGGRMGKGLVICFAAGNEDLPTHLTAQQNKHGLEYFESEIKGIHFKGEEIHGLWTEINGVIVVASYTSMNKKSLYSNWGPNITVASPSDNWHPKGPSTRKKYHSVNLVTTDNELHGEGLFGVGLSDVEEGYATHGMGGTSGATPIVAGVCGLVLSANSNLSAKQVKEIIEATGNKNDLDFNLDENMYNNKGQSGHFSGTKKHSLWFGYGKINAEAAVLKAKSFS